MSRRAFDSRFWGRFFVGGLAIGIAMGIVTGRVVALLEGYRQQPTHVLMGFLVGATFAALVWLIAWGIFVTRPHADFRAAEEPDLRQGEMVELIGPARSPGGTQVGERGRVVRAVPSGDGWDVVVDWETAGRASVDARSIRRVQP